MLCRVCCQQSICPYNTQKVTDRRLKYLYTFLVCSKCLEACHFGCQNQPLVQDEYDIIDLKDEFNSSAIIYECNACQKN